MEKELPKYRISCTLTFGDIYGQIIVWLIVIFIALATTLAIWSSTRQPFAFLTIGVVLVVSLPFLVFAFVTTLLNHIEFLPIDAAENQPRFSLERPKNPPASEAPASAS